VKMEVMVGFTFVEKGYTIGTKGSSHKLYIHASIGMFVSCIMNSVLLKSLIPGLERSRV